jgi:hypothetical protein
MRLKFSKRSSAKMLNSQPGERKWMKNMTGKRQEEVSLIKRWKIIGF